MKTFYYVAFRKKRGFRPSYAGDGVWDATNKTIARKEIAAARGVPAKRLKIVEKDKAMVETVEKMYRQGEVQLNKHSS